MQIHISIDDQLLTLSDGDEVLRLQSFCMTISMGQLIPIVKFFLAVAEFVISGSHRNAKVSKQSGFYDSSFR